MPRDFTTQKAKQILALCVTDKKTLLFHNGAIIKNLQELGAALCVMDQEQFEYHVNDKKNDIASWIKNIIGDHKLARTLVPFKTLSATKLIMNRRIAELESLAHPTQEKQKAKLLRAEKKLVPKEKEPKNPAIMIIKERTPLQPSIQNKIAQQPSLWKKLVKVLVS